MSASFIDAPPRKVLSRIFLSSLEVTLYVCEGEREREESCVLLPLFEKAINTSFLHLSCLVFSLEFESVWDVGLAFKILPAFTVEFR